MQPACVSYFSLGARSGAWHTRHHHHHHHREIEWGKVNKKDKKSHNIHYSLHQLIIVIRLASRMKCHLGQYSFCLQVSLRMLVSWCLFVFFECVTHSCSRSPLCVCVSVCSWRIVYVYSTRQYRREKEATVQIESVTCCFGCLVSEVREKVHVKCVHGKIRVHTSRGLCFARCVKVVYYTGTRFDQSERGERGERRERKCFIISPVNPCPK